jgi:hypothetical protein
MGWMMMEGATIKILDRSAGVRRSKEGREFLLWGGGTASLL